MNIQQIEINRIWKDERLPRKNIDPEEQEKLKKSVQQDGLLEPIVVRMLTEEERKGLGGRDSGLEYGLIAGERRMEAVKALGWKEIACQVLNVSPKEGICLALVENLQRQDLSYIEQADAIKTIAELYPEISQEELGNKIGFSRIQINRYLAIAGLSKAIKEKILPYGTISIDAENISDNFKSVKTVNFSFRHAYALTLLKDQKDDILLKAFDMAIADSMTVDKVQSLVKWVNSGKSLQSFGAKKKTGRYTDPLAEKWEPLPPYIKISKTKKGYRIVADEIYDEEIEAVAYTVAGTRNKMWVEATSDFPEDARCGEPNAEYLSVAKNAALSALPVIRERKMKELKVGEAGSAQVSDSRQERIKEKREKHKKKKMKKLVKETDGKLKQIEKVTESNEMKEGIKKLQEIMKNLLGE